MNPQFNKHTLKHWCRRPSLHLFFLLFLTNFLSYGQDVYEKRQSVILEASIQQNPPRITLHWVLDTANGGYTIWRKAKEDANWIYRIDSLGPKSTSWTDSNVVKGKGYEYQVIKSLPAFPYPNGKANFGSGYIYSGIQLSAKHHRGSCLLVVDSTFKQSLSFELSRLINDIESDGWMASVIYVNRNDSVTRIKNQINSWALDHLDSQRTLFLFGRVPVPYSGNISPDGHSNDHKGAWPCDGYYADLNGKWTDQTVNVNGPGTRNDNLPGDGKFDQSVFPSPLELQVGRVDFSNMNLFPESEEQLLRRYLNKDHAWRTGKLFFSERALIDNNYPNDLEALGQTGWKNFSSMFGFSKIKELPYRQTLAKQSYLWSYGCGGGGPEGASDISNTTYFVSDSLQTAFTLLFGSYFGDWDFPNNFLRASIASRSGLASMWGNRPNWYLHHMALGEHIGYSSLMTMANTKLYYPLTYGNYIHTALMGDPTLRMHIFPPVENLKAKQVGVSLQLTWRGPSNALGYFIYKKTSRNKTFVLQNQVPLADTIYRDPCPDSGMVSYMVKGVELKSSASGSYFNLSSGVSTSILLDHVDWILNPTIINCSGGMSNGSISIRPESGCPPYQFLWDTGEKTAKIQGLSPGVYCVSIRDCMNCTETYCAKIDLTSNTQNLIQSQSWKVLPNPATTYLNVNCPNGYQIYSVSGQLLKQSDRTTLSINISDLQAGIYILKTDTQIGRFIKLD